MWGTTRDVLCRTKASGINFLLYNKMSRIEKHFADHGYATSQNTPAADCTKLRASFDIVFEIEEHPVYVNKDVVCANSPVFDAMLNGNFDEKNQTIITIADDMYNDFKDLMTIIHPPVGNHHSVFSENVSGVVQLADKYQMAGVLELCEQYLLASCANPCLQDLLMAQKYGLVRFISHCALHLCKTMTLSEIRSEVNNLSVDVQLQLIISRLSAVEKFFQQYVMYVYGTWIEGIQHLNERVLSKASEAMCGFKSKIKPSLSGKDCCKIYLESSLESGDVIISVNGRSIRASGNVLRANSPVFVDMMNKVGERAPYGDTLILSGSDVTYDDFVILMTIIHPPVNMFAITDDNVKSVSRLAHKYKMQGVTDWCENHLLHHANLNMCTLVTAQRGGMPTLLKQCIEHISRSLTATAIIENEAYVELDSDTKLALVAERLNLLESLFSTHTFSKLRCLSTCKRCAMMKQHVASLKDLHAFISTEHC